MQMGSGLAIQQILRQPIIMVRLLRNDIYSDDHDHQNYLSNLSETVKRYNWHGIHLTVIAYNNCRIYEVIKKGYGVLGKIMNPFFVIVHP